MFSEEQKQALNKLCKISDIHSELELLINRSENNIKELKAIESAINTIIEEKTKGFPWLADAIAQFKELADLKIADFLEQKLTPAKSSADRLREVAKEKRILESKFRITRNLIKYYEALFPWLPEFVGEDLDDLIKQVSERSSQRIEDDDPIKFYLTKGEYEKLSPSERNQRALDRYWKKKKSNWEIGRDYERYNGYLCEKNGYAVSYQGIVEGLEDLGRDLIARRGDEIEIIQCKCWAHYKTIHEKHVCQLFGTTLKYWLENQICSQKDHKFTPELFPQFMRDGQIKGVLITSTSISPVARDFSRALGIAVKENFPFQSYPSIKCNISRRTGEKIYHLPMDQQYDRTVIEEERNECYVETVADAEKLGFRRAWRWRGDKKE